MSFNFGFVILSPEHNVGRLKMTVNSVRSRYPANVQCVCVTDKSAIAADISEMENVCPTFRGGNTFTSLINKGLSKGHKEWNIIVIEGTSIRRGLDQKYARFMESELDVLFPIVVDYDREGKPAQMHITFDEATLNGICIHQKTFKAVGPFGDGDLQLEKLLWAAQATEKGCKFKGILGAKLI